MHLQHQKTLIRHCIQVSVQAVDDDDARVTAFNAVANVCRELAWRHLRGVDLLESDMSGIDIFFERQAERPRPRFARAASLVKGEKYGVLAAFSRRDRVGERDGGLADARRADQKRI